MIMRNMENTTTEYAAIYRDHMEIGAIAFDVNESDDLWSAI